MANRRLQERRIDDAKRRRENPWRSLYATKEWANRRAAQKAKHPFCQDCQALGKATPMRVADHVIPHRGDRKLFFQGALRSLCKPCHDSAKQREELEGFRREVDAEGWPVDPRHPFNRASSRFAASDEDEKRDSS